MALVTYLRKQGGRHTAAGQSKRGWAVRCVEHHLCTDPLDPTASLPLLLPLL